MSRTVCVVLVLALAATARANSSNWFVLDTNDGASAGYSVIGGGTEGTTLDIERTAASEPTRFSVVLRSAVTLSSLLGYSLHLTSPQTTRINAVSAQILNHTPFPTPPVLNDEFRPQSNLVFNVGGYDPGVPPGTTGDLLRITFEVEEDGGSTETIEIFGAIGRYSWDDGADAQYNPIAEFAGFGSNPPFFVGGVVVDTEVGPEPLIVVNLAPELRADVNGDGFVNLDDIWPFVDVLLGTPQAPEHVERSDLNDDGTADGMDIAPFLEALIGT